MWSSTCWLQLTYTNQFVIHMNQFLCTIWFFCWPRLCFKKMYNWCIFCLDNHNIWFRYTCLWYLALRIHTICWPWYYLKVIGVSFCLSSYVFYRSSYLIKFPKGGWGCLNSDVSPPCVESQGCHLSPLFFLLSCSSAHSHCSFCLVFFSAYWPIFLPLKKKNSLIFLVKR